MVSKRLPLSALIDLCRSLRHNLSAGLTLLAVFEQQSLRGAPSVRPIAKAITQELQQGHDLEHALKAHKEVFPPMFLSMARVGEQSGALPTIFGELEKYFLLQQRLRRQFWAKISWPLVQFFLAIFVLAGMIFILGMFGSNFDPLGLGLTGTDGALWFLIIAFGILGLAYGIWKLLTRSLQRRAKVDKKLLTLPLIGPALEAIALQRFCLSMRLTLETSMGVGKAVRMSLRATDNSAYTEPADAVIQSLKKGNDLAGSLRLHGCFPEDFLNIIANAEEGGRLTEVMAQQSQQYEEEASRRLGQATAVASYGVWLIVGGLIILAIFRLASTYFNLLNQV